MRIKREFFLLFCILYICLNNLFLFVYSRKNSKLFGLYQYGILNSLDNKIINSKSSGIFLEDIKRINSCFLPELQENKWYAPMIYFRRYKVMDRVYRKCSTKRLKAICKEFSEILNCEFNENNDEMTFLSEGKEASTIFSILNKPKNEDSNKNFELFSGCIYELGKKSLLRVRCLHSNKVDIFPLKLIIKVDGRTSDFSYHFNHELIIYSRIASSVYGNSKIRLHPSIYSIFVNPNRKIIAKDLLIMEFINGPSMSSIFSKLTTYGDLSDYIRNKFIDILEENTKIYDSKISLDPQSNSVDSKLKFLEHSINNWLESYVDKKIIFSINIYKRLSYLLDLFHRGGISFYPEEKDNFSRGRWKHKRSFRLHCDLHQGNILVEFPDYKNQTDLSYENILNINFYKNLKIIDLEQAVELSESEFPVPVDKFAGMHPCPVYSTDAELFSSSLLNNLILISTTLLSSLQNIQNYFLGGNGTTKLILKNKVLSDWIKRNDTLKNSEISYPSFKINNSINKIKLHLHNWKHYIHLMTEDEMMRPCISHYHVKYGSGVSKKIILPCSWLSNIQFPQRSCKYMEMAHGSEFGKNYTSIKLDPLEKEKLSKYVLDLYDHSKKIKCQIDPIEALNITVNNISKTVIEYFPPVSKFNESYWNEWSSLFRNLKAKETLNNSNIESNALDSISDSFNELNTVSNFKTIWYYNLLLSSEAPQTNSQNKTDFKSSFGLVDSKQSDLPNSLNLIKTEKINNNENISNTNSSLSFSLSNNELSAEFEKILLELMGLAALQRIMGFCNKFKSEIDCESIDYSKIKRDGPIASYSFRLTENYKSTDSINKNSFNKLLNLCVLPYEKDSSEFNLTNITWVCSELIEPFEGRLLNIIVDGRLFLDLNNTFIDQSKNQFVFDDILDYFEIKNKTRFNKDFNDEAISILNKHKRDAIFFWHMETKMRNLISLINNNESQISQNITSDNLLSEIFVFNSHLNKQKAQVKLIMDSFGSHNTSDFYYLNFSNKRNDLSKRIKSIVQVGLLSENIFIAEDQSRYSVSNIISEVENFHNSVNLDNWVTYSTLALSIFKNLINNHSYLILVSYKTLEFLEKLRSKKDFDIISNHDNTEFNSQNINKTNFNVIYKDNKIPIICNFSSKKIAILGLINARFIRLINAKFDEILSKLKNFTLFDVSNINSIEMDHRVSDICSSENYGKTDLHVLINKLLIPSLDPISSLYKAISKLLKPKYYFSVEIRRSIWFIAHVYKHIVKYIEKITTKEADLTKKPILIRSLADIVLRKNKIVEFILSTFKCADYNKINGEINIERCKMKDYIDISRKVSEEMLSLFSEQHHLFANATSLYLTQEFISYVEDHLDIPSPKENPPSGGLGFLFEKKNRSEFIDKCYSTRYKNKSIAYSIKMPIIADIWDYLN